MADRYSPENPFESIPNPEEEASQINDIADLTVKLLDKRYPKPKKTLRGVHPKSHGCLEAVFRVNSDIDKDLQVGLFANPGKTYSALARFSNASVHVAHDLEGGKNGSRGMAIKVFDVQGKVLLDDNRKSNQDFLMINTSAFAFANVADYHRLTQILIKNNDDPSMFFAPLQAEIPGITDEEKMRIFKSFKVVQEIQSRPVANPLEIQYFSAAPFLFGPDRVMKFSAEPSGGAKPQNVPDNPSENYLNEALTKTMEEAGELIFDLKIQVRGSEPTLGIEDATSVWDENETPFINVATLTIQRPQPKINSVKHLKECEKLVFTPWHSLPEHQPLGGINRLRKGIYVASSTHRGAAKKIPPGKGKK